MTTQVLAVLGILALAALAAAVLVAARWLAGKLEKPRDDVALVLLQNQVNALQGQVAQALEATQQALNTRLDRAAQALQGLQGQLGELGEVTRQILDVGRDISGLQEILRAPKPRGGLGEFLLGDLLAQILPADHYQVQYEFRGGEKVDAVIRLRDGLVPVDAKFPVENFRRLLQTLSEEERAAARRQFARDVKKHIDDIARKYIRPDEGTFDFALMYIPAENVYYETIVSGESGETSLFQYALDKRVIPVSPNSFYAYLQTILLGLKGMRIEESAREIVNRLQRVSGELGRFREAFALIGKHLENSLKQYREAEARLDKIAGKFEELARLPPQAGPRTGLPPPSAAGG